MEWVPDYCGSCQAKGRDAAHRPCEEYCASCLEYGHTTCEDFCYSCDDWGHSDCLVAAWEEEEVDRREVHSKLSRQPMKEAPEIISR